MYRKIHFNLDEWFYLQKELEKAAAEAMQYIVITGARGCGKTVSMLKIVTENFRNGKKVLYIRNARNETASARSYFGCLATGENQQINLGSLGAGTIVLEDGPNRELIGYSLFVGDYESFKSNKKHIDYIIYEEFSSFSGSGQINRSMAIIELSETIRQTVPDFKFYAISNNVFYDDLFENLFDKDTFIHFQITKDTALSGVKHKGISNYLQGQYLVPDVSISLKNYNCIGYTEVSGEKLYIFENEMLIPNSVVSSSGTGKELKLTMELIDKIMRSSYRSLKDRNRCEFTVGIIRKAGGRLKT